MVSLLMREETFIVLTQWMDCVILHLKIVLFIRRKPSLAPQRLQTVASVISYKNSLHPVIYITQYKTTFFEITNYPIIISSTDMLLFFRNVSIDCNRQRLKL